MENMQELDAMAFATDRKLLHDLMAFHVPRIKPLGLVLISSKKECVLCGSKLQVRKDWSASVIIYDDDMGTILGSHFHKHYTNPTCGCTQYYGYYTTGGSSSDVLFNLDWEKLPYFVSSRERVFFYEVTSTT